MKITLENITTAAELSAFVYGLKNESVTVFKNRIKTAPLMVGCHYRDCLQIKDSEALVCDNDKNIYIAIRGTSGIEDVTADLDFGVSPCGNYHKGLSQNGLVFSDYIRNLALNSSKKIILCGHSKGGAEALILSDMLDRSGIDNCVITFGAPRCIVKPEETVLGSSDLTKLNITKSSDVVPCLPFAYKKIQPTDFYNPGVNLNFSDNREVELRTAASDSELLQKLLVSGIGSGIVKLMELLMKPEEEVKIVYGIEWVIKGHTMTDYMNIIALNQKLVHSFLLQFEINDLDL